MNNIKKARSALNSINSGCPREDWVLIGMAVKSAGLSFEDFHEWSESAHNYQSEQDCQNVWDSFSVDGGITAATLYKYAGDAGWQYSNFSCEDEVLSNVNFEQEDNAIFDTEEVDNLRALRIWEQCISATIDEPYINRKQGKPNGLRVYPETAPHFSVKGRSVAGSLVIPCYSKNKLITLQFILKDSGEKFNLPGASLGNSYFTVGEIKNCIYLCEGIGQAWAINVATSEAAIVCFGSGRFKNVAKVVRAQYPSAKLIIAPDRGKEEQASKVATSFSCSLVELPLNKPDNYDVNDYMKDEGVSQLKRLLETHKKPKKSSSGEENEKQNQASVLVSFALSKTIVFHDSNSNTYSQDKRSNEIKKLESKGFKAWLSAEYYAVTRASVRDQSLREAVGTLCGIARHEGECHDVHIRIAQYENAYYIDLGEKKLNRAICIKAGEWEVITNPPVKFIRPESMRPLPEPAGSGDISKLWSLINIPEESRVLIVTWLIECFRPDTPFPILELVGEQGSAKSTTQHFLRQLIDPNACDLRGAPKTIDDIFVSAGVNWLVSYENVSHLPSQVQDALCVLSTGGGHAKRTLYSDMDETVISVKRPIVINGISVAITSQDLIDRTISIETPIIRKRTEITNIQKEFKENYGVIFSYLLTIFSKSLARLDDVDLKQTNSTRLIEFVRLGVAVSEVMGFSKDTFLNQFQESREEAIARTIDASPVASAVINYHDNRKKKAISLPIKELFREIISYDLTLGCNNWPKTPKGFADALRRAAPALRYYGINCYSEGKKGSHVYWKIEPIKNN